MEDLGSVAVEVVYFGSTIGDSDDDSIQLVESAMSLKKPTLLRFWLIMTI